ncbi:DUF3618 domain-containing protein [uncultured Sphingomonas sp.]|uniref:DUF3618 domain-containing protein n=1 Tax=uncultured Sphingomonas sp. TaxID=158754 RepID=UPI0025F29638|nr:DUF3618 domain-containing protein [uncultured Sphingomonas sp.]
MSAQDIANARLEAAAARERLLGSAHDLQGRLNPSVLANHAWDGARDRGEQVAGEVGLVIVERPVAAGAVAAGVLAFLARRPIFRMLGRLTGRRKTFDGDRK